MMGGGRSKERDPVEERIKKNPAWEYLADDTQLYYALQYKSEFEKLHVLITDDIGLLKEKAGALYSKWRKSEPWRGVVGEGYTPERDALKTTAMSKFYDSLDTPPSLSTPVQPATALRF
jgi:hypothetical protein